MVRGYESCPRLCETCKEDCRCSICDKCHSCRPSLTIDAAKKRFLDLASQSNQGQNSFYVNTKQPAGCRTYKHDCLEDTPKVGNSCWESFVKLRGTSPGNEMDFRKFAHCDIIKVFIGESNKPYHVHESLLCAESPYFEGMLSSGMSESQTRMVTMNLEVDTPLAFEKFMQWCYFGYYVYGDQKNSALVSVDAAVYIFADRVQCEGLKSFALKQAASLCASKDNTRTLLNLSELPQTVSFIYDNTADDDEEELGSSATAPLAKKYPAAAGGTGNGRSTMGLHSPKDGFRKLLAAFSALNLDHLRKESSFMAVYRSLPDFAADVLFFVKQGTDFDIPGLSSEPKKSSCIVS